MNLLRPAYITPVLLFTACILLSLMYCPPYDVLVDDKEVFKYTGLVILKGGVPYRDFFDHKPPLIFFFNFAGLLLGNWGFWLINLFTALLATGLFYKLCRQYRLIYPWLLPLLFNFMIRDHLISQGINMTREYTSFFLVIFFCIMMGKYRYRDFLMGLLAGLIFFMQQDQVLQLLPFLICTLGSRDSDPVRPVFRIIRMGTAFMAIVLPVLGYFAWHHALGYFWQDAFLFNFSWYTAEKKSIPDHFRTIKQALDAGNYEMPVMIALTLGITGLFLKNQRRRWLIASLMGTVLSLSQEFLGGRTQGFNASYYFLPLSASVTILLFSVFAFTEDESIRNRKFQSVMGVLLFCSLGYTALQHATHLVPRNYDPITHSPELIYLREHRPGDNQLYVFGNSSDIYYYNEFRILAPSVWIYHHFWKWYDRWDPDQHLLQSIGQDLLRHKTVYIIMDFPELARFRNPVNAAWWRSFLEAHYQLVRLPGAENSKLWQIKDPSY